MLDQPLSCSCCAACGCPPACCLWVVVSLSPLSLLLPALPAPAERLPMLDNECEEAGGDLATDTFW